MYELIVSSQLRPQQCTNTKPPGSKEGSAADEAAKRAANEAAKGAADEAAKRAARHRK